MANQGAGTAILSFGAGAQAAVNDAPVSVVSDSNPNPGFLDVRTGSTMPGGSLSWQSVAWNGTVFCAVATSGSTVAATSPDGIYWTAQTMPSASNWSGITWNGSVFCAIGNGTAIAATSPDGVTWTPRTLPSSQSWFAMTWNGSIFCAVGVAGSSASATSPDGITWTPGTMPTSGSWGSIAWNGTVFCSLNGGTTAGATSPDGITWTPQTLPVSGGWSAMAWNGKVFCALHGSNATAITSPDGVNWTIQTLPASAGWTSLSWNGAVFLAGTNNLAIAATSPDGVNWTQWVFPTTYAFGTDGFRFVAVQNTGNSSTVAIIGKSVRTTTPVANQISPAYPSPGVQDASVTVTGVTGMGASAGVSVALMGSDSTASHNTTEHELVDIKLSVDNVSYGQFTINGFSRERLVGDFKVRYAWSNP